MSDYTKFRIEAIDNGRLFKVQVRGWFCWKSSFVYTDYFCSYYHSKQEALDAIDGYKNRFTEYTK